jgi:uncharacterized membrane protein YtjA (UPF0391 family)
MTTWILIVGVVAAVLGLTGLAGPATHLAWISFVISLIIFLLSFIERERPF